MNDDDLTDFADWLSEGKQRSGRYINRLLLRVIDFYIWAQDTVLGKRIVGGDSEFLQISISRKIVKVPRGRGRSIRRHRAMLPNNVPRTVHPMSTKVFYNLLDSSDKLSKTGFVRKRNRMLLVLLADSGLRREELTIVTVESILQSAENGMIKVKTSKRRGNPERVIPLPRETTDALCEYVKTSREILIRRLKKRHAGFIDEGWAFCTRYGGRLAPSTISQLFSDLREHANVSEVATAHMLRHRFITIQLVTRLKKAGSKSTIGVEFLTTILSQLASVSGHASIDSLWQYVDWAFDELDQAEDADVSANSKAKEIIVDMIEDAKACQDDTLVQDLRIVLETITTLETGGTVNRSVLAHSLRSRATR
ncbi:tyrosine-type recombinase/integrase [Pseudomonas rubra]|uniref:Site-specific integrase n=1 Tax=Pseudomonas rubra TaxID=2942627 RepID=A0ABT5PCQ1_9PSED|nr:site-specific integrase [Pseudomonas rubra]MDD1016077.1 site-specific integrase [Pseudomonas rubra]MDD1040000.1 site-specific integrase [Pseudomonas rubra]MDD1156299.1 site-specific integrase [Pseudomonas rubra]